MEGVEKRVKEVAEVFGMEEVPLMSNVNVVVETVKNEKMKREMLGWLIVEILRLAPEMNFSIAVEGAQVSIVKVVTDKVVEVEFSYVKEPLKFRVYYRWENYGKPIENFNVYANRPLSPSDVHSIIYALRVALSAH